LYHPVAYVAVILAARPCADSRTYILCELNGSVFHRPIAAFWTIPYFARKSLPLPLLDEILDISTEHLWEMEEFMLSDPEDNEVEQ
jgi:hypothetical protein